MFLIGFFFFYRFNLFMSDLSQSAVFLQSSIAVVHRLTAVWILNAPGHISSKYSFIADRLLSCEALGDFPVLSSCERMPVFNETLT